MPLNSRGRSRVLAFRRVNDHLTKPMDLLRELRVARSSDTQLFLFAMRANVRATGPLAHAWRDGDGHAQSTVRSVNVGSYPGSARLVATQRIGEECQLPTHAVQQAA